MEMEFFKYARKEGADRFEVIVAFDKPLDMGTTAASRLGLRFTPYVSQLYLQERACQLALKYVFFRKIGLSEGTKIAAFFGSVFFATMWVAVGGVGSEETASADVICGKHADR